MKWLSATSVLFLVTSLSAFSPPGLEKTLPNVDKRRDRPITPHQPKPGQAAALERLRNRVPDLRIELDALRHTPKHLASSSGFLSGPNGEGRGLPAAQAHGRAAQDPHRPIKDFLDEHAALFGHGARVLEGARLRRDAATPHNGLHTVVWEQRVDDIAVDEGVLIGNISARGELVSLSSLFLPEAARAAEVGTPNRAAVEQAPPISATQAIVNTARNLGEPLEAVELEPMDAQPAGNERRQRFRPGPLPDDARARLVWLPLGEYSLRLCWEVELTRREGGERYQVLVDALTGEVEVRRRLTVYASDVTFRVFTSDSPTPLSPGWPAPDTNQPPGVGRSLVTWTALNTNASPIGWISDGENETRGNNVDAHLDRNGDNVPDLPRPQGSPFRVFDPPLDLAQDPAASADAAVVQLFYWCNWMHDRLYDLGFTEAAGNFQKDNFGRGGAGNDAVQADAQDGSGFSNANFTPTEDGEPGRIQMFLWNAATPTRDGDLDGEVILHEYTHGLSTRLVGGGSGITGLQTAGMGEGWSDFYALSLLSEPGDDVDATYAFGAYVVRQLNGLQENYYFGIRRYPYCTDLNKNPLTFKDIDPFQISPHPGVPLSPLIGFNPLNAGEVHSQGEVWCAMLWEARASLIHKHGFSTGNQLMLRLVTDGMKLSPPNPTFPQARDAILLADQVNNQGQNYGELWTAFAKRGLGFSAFAPDSATTSGVGEAFDLPDSLLIVQADRLISSGPAGGPFSAPCRSYSLTNLSLQPLSWRVSASQPWLTVSPPAGTLGPAGAAVVQICLNSNALALPVGTFSDVLLFSNAVSGVLQQREAQLTVMNFTSMPFVEDFESGELQSYWSVSGTGAHAATVTPLNEPHGGGFHLTLDALNGIKSRNEVTLGIDLAGYTNVELRFWARSFGDEPDGPPPTPFIGEADFDGVAISQDGVTWYEVQSLRAVPPAYREFIVPLDAAVAKFGLQYNEHFRIRFNQVDDFQIPFDGLALDDISLTGDGTRRITVSAPANTVEGAGTLPQDGFVRIGSPAAQDLTVHLTSSQPGKIRLPDTVIIPAGSDQAFFPVTVLDDAELDGTSLVSLGADAVGFVSGQASIRVADNERAVLKLHLPPRAREGDGLLAKQGTVRTTTRPARDVQVQLRSSDPQHLKVPATIVLPAGQMSVQFDLVVGDEDRLDGAHEITVTAHVENWQDGADRILILDNESPALSVMLPLAVGESNGVRTNAGIVRISGRLPTNLVVALASSDLTALRVPSTVLVKSNQLQASFDLMPVDDTRVDGRQLVTVTARAPGFASGSAQMGIDDDETPPGATQPLPKDHGTNVSVTVSLGWNPGVGNILLNGGFEAGDFTGWSQINGGYGGWVINDGKVDPDGPEGQAPPLSGKFGALVAQIGGGTHHLFQEVFLPPDALGATLSWADRIHNYATHFAPDQAFRVEVRDTNNTVLDVAYETQTADPLLNEWTQRSFDLARFRGRAIRIAFVELDSIGYLNVALDNVSVFLAEPGVPTTFDVYFGTNPSPGAAEFRGNITNALWTPPRLALNTTYYWQVIARRGTALARGPVWQFSTRGVGPVDHFEWGRIASPQLYDQRFAVTATAKDDLNNTVKDFNGAVGVRALPGGGTRSSIVITELDIAFNDRVEFANTTKEPINLAGWQITLYDTFSWPAPLLTLTLPSGAVCPPAAVFQLDKNGEAPGQFPNFNAGTNITWSLADFGNPIAVLVQDPAGNVVDFVCAGDADPALITRPIVLPAEEWNGPPVVAALTVFNLSLQRIGDGDHHDRSDWTPAVFSFGQRNAGLSLPFPPPPSLALEPRILTNFVTGVWAGFLTIRDVAPRLSLKADDGHGHTGTSGGFEVGAAGDFAVAVSDSPNVVLIGETLTYKLFVSNSGPSRATGVTLTNLLPPGVAFVSVDTFDGACRNDDGRVSCQLEPLFAGDISRVTIHARAVQPGQLTNVAFITRAESDGFAANNRAEAISTATYPSITTTNLLITEGNSGTTLARVPVRLSAASTLPVSVSYASSNGTAIAGVDYLPVSGRLLFEPGVTNLFITVPLLGDLLDEALETFSVKLFDPTNGVLVISQARFRILNDDQTPSVSIGDVSLLEGPAGQTNDAIFTVRLSAASGLPVTVDYTTADGTASAPADYLTAFGTLTFPSGTTTQFVRVRVLGDNRFESNEVFTVTLFNPFAVNITRSTATGTILDDDAGELDRFVWSSIPSPQYLGIPFAATLTALNGLNQPATNFNGTLTLRGAADSREAPVGQATNTWNFPLGTLYHDARTQVIYLPQELGGAGRINALALDVVTVPGQPLTNWTIRLKHTNRTSEPDPAWEADGWTTVYRNDELVAGTGWVTFLFDQPFAYDGTNSLLVDFSFDNATYSNDGLVRSTPTPQPRSLAFQTDSAFGDPQHWAGKSAPPPTAFARVPNVRFFMESAVAMTPTGLIRLTNGVWTGQITVQQTATNLLLRAGDREGHLAVGNMFAVETAADADADGLPDAWEAQHFGSAADGQGRGDPDGDGSTNLDEFRAGTDPQNRGSVMRIQAILARGSDRIIRFTSVSGKVYRLERTENLANPGWTPVNPDLPGTGGVLEAVDRGAATAGATFYRLRLLP